ncbi:hypothetical protein E2562_039487 [Oryza meyeriana var. granulata]|uniref:cysteine dioxygenase n=1 Tax=Oryza meyeriana var. granulata TaxID=110450 RepID=A0A6G1DTY6_9ORYZ|nr:hypothetical protein E2562_039487 [Oryza meyeriana var. granulata]
MAMDDHQSKVQRLYEACDAVFSSGNKAGLPTLTQIRWLQDLLGTDAADVGIDVGGGSERSSSSPPGRRFVSASAFTRITYVHIYERDDFSIGVFCFPAGATLLLHDHPQMVVLSKLLYGSMRVKSYDWANGPPCSGPRKSGLARVVAVDEVQEAPCKASVLFPRSGGNIHSLTAVTPCALLDVLAPPYAEDLGRPSTYFSDIPIPSLPGTPYVGPELTVDVDIMYN